MMGRKGVSQNQGKSKKDNGKRNPCCITEQGSQIRTRPIQTQRREKLKQSADLNRERLLTEDMEERRRNLERYNQQSKLGDSCKNILNKHNEILNNSIRTLPCIFQISFARILSECHREKIALSK